MKRFSALLLAALMLVSACMLSACHKKLTAGEQFEEALEDIFAPISDLYKSVGIDPAFKSPENARTAFDFKIDELDAAGESLSDDDSFAFHFTTQQYKEITGMTFGVEALQENFTGSILTDNNDTFLIYDGIMEKPAKISQDEQGIFSNMLQSNALQKVFEEIKEELLNDETMFSITEAEGGKQYTLTVDKERFKAYAERMLSTLSQKEEQSGSSTPSIATILDDLKETAFKLELKTAKNAPSELHAVWTDDEQKTVQDCLLTVTKGENSAELKLTMRDDEKETMSAEATFTAQDGKLEAQMTVKSDGKRVMELEMTSQKDGDSIKSDATMTVSLNMGGAVLSVPVKMSCVTKYGKQTMDSTLQITLSIPSLFETGITVTIAVAPGEKLELPTDFVDADSINSDELKAKIAGKYPNLYKIITSTSGISQ